MSGGSLDYMCYEDFPKQWQFERMINELRERVKQDVPGAAAALADTEQLYATTYGAERTKLNEVWRCVEWCLSCDYTEDQVAAALVAYTS